MQSDFKLSANYDSAHIVKKKHTTRLSTNPIALTKMPQRSPLRVRFFVSTLESVSYAIDMLFLTI